MSNLFNISKCDDFYFFFKLMFSCGTKKENQITLKVIFFDGFHSYEMNLIKPLFMGGSRILQGQQGGHEIMIPARPEAHIL